MMRSLIAVILAVIAGLAVTRAVEGGIGALTDLTPTSPLYGYILLASWFFGAFAASFIALLLARRWAPVGIVAAGSIFLSAMLALVTASLSWLLWPGAIIITAAGAYAAIKLLKADYSLPAQSRKGGLFNE